jgi:signal transduction histidine kinase
MDSALMAMVVHDLRNPMAALISNLGFVADRVRDDEAASEAASDCMLSLEVLVRLVDNLDAIGRLDGGPAASGEVAVTEVIASVERRMRRHAEAAGVRLATSSGPGAGRALAGARLVELAVDNLVATSIAYAPLGSTVRVEARRADDGAMVIAVLDDGQPVAESARSLVSSRDGQAALKAATGGRYGRGLGLYVASLVAGAAGGALHAGERDGAALFELRLASPAVTPA